MKTTVLHRSLELDTGIEITGNYIEEPGYYMIDGKPDYNRPVVRHYIQDSNCIKHEIAPDFLSSGYSTFTDSEGKIIFAALNKDGMGGDSLEAMTHDRHWLDTEGETKKLVCVFHINTPMLFDPLEEEGQYYHFTDFKEYKVKSTNFNL